MRIALLVFLAAVLISYAIANTHGIPADEVSPMNSALLRAASWTGIVLLANDGLTEWAQVQILLRRAAVIGGLLALLGLAQFITGDLLVDRISLPGLVDDASSTVANRGGFTRPSGTATHPLEYAVVLSASLPLAVAVAVNDQIGGAARRWWPPLVIALATVVSISRSAIVGVGVSMIVLIPALSRTIRWLIGIGAGFILIAAYIAVPGLVGTLRGLFLFVGSDTSTTSRTGALDGALHIASNYGPFGRGFGSFLPKYWILDNQILGLYIEIGVAGLAAFLGLIATGMVIALRVARPPRSEESVLAQALAAALAGTAILYFFFDALSFTMAAGTLFLLLGIIGAVGNIGRPLPPQDKAAATSLSTSEREVIGDA